MSDLKIVVTGASGRMGRTLIREIAYAIPDERREMRAARYLNWRINRLVNTEDTGLIAGVQEGMASPSFQVGPLSDTEVCLRGFVITVGFHRRAQNPQPMIQFLEIRRGHPLGCRFGRQAFQYHAH